MTVLIKLLYAASLATLLILSLAFGVRTFYSAPEAPEFPEVFPQPVGSNDPILEEMAEEQRRYQEAYEQFVEDRAEYRRNVFFVAIVFALMFVALGVSIPAHLDALRLGLVAGGLGTLLYAVIQAGDDLDEVGSVMVFLVALAGLAVVLGAGYRWLRTFEEQSANRS